jgi:hypothetical protein
VILMDVVPMNWVAVVVAAIAYMAIGFAWYSDLLFGKQYRKLMGVKDSDMKPGKDFMMKMMVLGIISALIMAYILTHNIVFAGSYLGTSGLVLGLSTGFFNWLGYQLIIFINGYLYERKSVQLTVINASYMLIALLAMGVIIAVWR